MFPKRAIEKERINVVCSMIQEKLIGFIHAKFFRKKKNYALEAVLLFF
jgi:hypothetical protein